MNALCCSAIVILVASRFGIVMAEETAANVVVVKVGEAPAETWVGRPENDAIDWLRQNLIFVFDLAEHHCQPDSDSHWRPSQEEIAEKLEEVRKGSYLEMRLKRPAPIEVEGREFLMKTLWVRIREKDWATFDWIFLTPKGQFVALSGIEGHYNRKLGPIIRELVFADEAGR